MGAQRRQVEVTRSKYRPQTVGILFISFATIFTNIAHSATEWEDSCVTRFAAISRTDVEAISPKLSHFLKGRGYERLARTQPADFNLIADSIARVQSATPQKISLSTDVMDGRVTAMKNNGVLDLTIDYIKLGERKKNQHGEKSKIAFGESNPSLSLGFPRLLVALGDGIEKQIVTDSSLKKISITGSNVINEQMVKQLQEFGFEGSVKSLIHHLLASKTGEGRFATIFAVLLPYAQLPNEWQVPIKLAATTTKVVASARRKEFGKNWTLVLTIENDIKPESSP